MIVGSPFELTIVGTVFCPVHFEMAAASSIIERMKEKKFSIQCQWDEIVKHERLIVNSFKKFSLFASRFISRKSYIEYANF